MTILDVGSKQKLAVLFAARRRIYAGRFLKTGLHHGTIF